MKFYSTRKKAPVIDFKRALFQGLAPDGGLYMPDVMPKLSLKEIEHEFPHIPNTNAVHKRGMSPQEKLGLVITEHVGTMRFFFIVFTWTVLWLSWNIFAPKPLRFDPFPAFVLWLFISNLIQLHLMPLLMVGQNIQAKHSELRSEHDYQTNKKAEKEIETIIMHLENQGKILQDLQTRLDKLEKK